MHDVVVERPASAEAPEWVRVRGWEGYLAGLTDTQVAAAECDPAAWLRDAVDAPADLREIAGAIRTLTRAYEDHGHAADSALRRHVKKRKREQLEVLCALAAERFSDARRVVDLGSGNGHLTRALAQTLGCESVGVDWDAQRVARAKEIGGDEGPRFVHADAAKQPVVLRFGDLVVGLHPCGALGDALVARARDAQADVLAVSCCFQKIDSAQWRGQSDRARDFVIPKHALGLANLAPVSFEGSGDLQEKRRGRRTRLALRIALEARGERVLPGAEARGVPKERVRLGLHEIAARAFHTRGLPAPTDGELEAASRTAEEQYARVARFALPRHALSRVLELAIVLDRACLLEEGGSEVEVRPLFSSLTSPRNLGIAARAPR